MAIQWPIAVNQKVLNYRPSQSMDIVEDNSDMIGYSKRRLRSTKPIIMHEFNMIFRLDNDVLFPLTEYGIFQAWVMSNLAGGTLSFMFPHPLNKTMTEMEFVITEGAAYELTRFSPHKSAQVKVKLKEV